MVELMPRLLDADAGAMSRLTHIDADGRARMVDVSDKAGTAREATARGRIIMAPETLALAVSGAGRRATCGRWPRSRGHGRQADVGPDPDVPSADADLGQGRRGADR
jgi:hypothetical protein